MLSDHFAIDEHITRPEALVQPGIHRGCRAGSPANVGDEYVLDVVREKEPSFVEPECTVEWVDVSHSCRTYFARLYAPSIWVYTLLSCCTALKGRCSVFSSDTRRDVIIESGENVFVFSSGRIRVRHPIREMESKWIFRVDAFRSGGSARQKFESSDRILCAVNLFDVGSMIPRGEN